MESKNNKFVFVIENKIDSSEGDDQLSRYEEIVKTAFANEDKLFAYLTKDGDPPSPPSDQLWSTISYSDVVDALEEAKSHHLSKPSDEATMVIEHYVALIRRNIVPDQELIDQCRKLYAQHKDAIDLIIRYGEVNTFDSAANQFFNSHADLKVVSKRTAAAAFIPMALYEVTHEMDGINWWGQSRPILCWFSLQSDNRFSLILEVGPFSGDKFNRETLVKQLQEYFRSKSKIYPKYTRVYSQYKRLTDDQVSDPEEIVATMTELYENIVVHHLSAVVEITRHFFGNK